MIQINDIELTVKYFPSGEQKIIMPNIILKKSTDNCDYIDIDWYYEKDEELITLFYVKRNLNNKFGNNIDINLFMPYYPNARMDRVKSDNEVFTLKYFSEFLNYMNFANIYTDNPHSDVCMALTNNIHQNEYDENRIKLLIEKNITPNKIDLLFYPDNGCAKKYEGVLKYPYLVGHKIRDWETGKIKELKIVGEAPKKPFNVLIVDDICSKGGTFLHSAKALKELGANHIYLYITHCEKTIFDGELINSGLIDKIYTTNSILPISYMTYPLIEVIK